jgi:hypothetical protein
MPPIVPRERFGADCRDLLRVGDILIGQAGADARPSENCSAAGQRELS